MLEDYPKEVILKDGTGLTLRPLKKGDGKSLFRMYESFSEGDKWFLDFDVEDFELIEQWTVQADQERWISIIALLEGKVVGHATLIRKYHGAKSNVGKIRISVAPYLREKHLGTWMLLDIVNLSIALGLDRVVLTIPEDRDPMVEAIIKKLDFFRYALLEDYLKDKEGNPCNLLILAKKLD